MANKGKRKARPSNEPLGISFPRRIAISGPAKQVRAGEMRPYQSWPTTRLKSALEKNEDNLAALKKQYPEQWRLIGTGETGPIEQRFGELNRRIEEMRLEILGRRTASATVSSPAQRAVPSFEHSPDYRSIRFKGVAHTLTAPQAHVIEILHQAFTQGTPAVGAAHILEELGSPSSRLRDTFKGSDLWNTLIVSGEKRGTYRLDLR